MEKGQRGSWKTEPPVREAGGWSRHGGMGVPDGMGGDRNCVGAVRRLEPARHREGLTHLVTAVWGKGELRGQVGKPGRTPGISTREAARHPVYGNPGWIASVQTKVKTKY